MKITVTPRVIHKQILSQPNSQPFRVNMNFMGRSLCVGLQDGEFVLWYETPQYFEKEVMFNRAVWMFGTGHPLPEGSLRYLNTLQIGGFVWHFYEGALLEPAARQGD